MQELAVLDLEGKASQCSTPTGRDKDSSTHSALSTAQLTPKMAAAVYGHQGNSGQLTLQAGRQAGVAPVYVYCLSGSGLLQLASALLPA